MLFLCLQPIILFIDNLILLFLILTLHLLLHYSFDFLVNGLYHVLVLARPSDSLPVVFRSPSASLGIGGVNERRACVWETVNWVILSASYRCLGPWRLWSSCPVHVEHVLWVSGERFLWASFIWGSRSYLLGISVLQREPMVLIGCNEWFTCRVVRFSLYLELFGLWVINITIFCLNISWLTYLILLKSLSEVLNFIELWVLSVIQRRTLIFSLLNNRYIIMLRIFHWWGRSFTSFHHDCSLNLNTKIDIE